MSADTMIVPKTELPDTVSVFQNADSSTLYPTMEGVAGFESYLQRYKACLRAEAAAADMI